jgi:hypothetical protein
MKTNLRFCPRVAIPYVALLGTGTMLAGCGGGSSLAVNPPVTTPAPTASCTTPSATITHTASAANAPQLVFLDKSKYPQALCNDGTPAAYVLRQGAGAAANRWIISLQGGGICYDQATCAARAAESPAAVSSAPYQTGSPGFGLEGLLDSTPANNPDFYDASMVELLYCSSDEWSGAKSSPSAFNSQDPTTWNFQGHAILNAVIADLKASHNFSAATDIMLTGQSAGGVGVFLNVNSVAKLVPSGTRFVAFSDAGFQNDVDSFNSTGAPPNYTNAPSTPNAGAAQIAQILLLWNASGDSVCSAAATPDPTSQGACFDSETLLAPGGTITFPMLVSISEKDTYALDSDGISYADLQSGNFTTPESGYIAYFTANMRTNLNSTNPGVSVFSPDSLVHVEATDYKLYQTPVTFPSGTITLQQAIGRWYNAPCSVQRNIAN